jgi:hypothetical protein
MYWIIINHHTMIIYCILIDYGLVFFNMVDFFMFRKIYKFQINTHFIFQFFYLDFRLLLENNINSFYYIDNNYVYVNIIGFFTQIIIRGNKVLYVTNMYPIIYTKPAGILRIMLNFEGKLQCKISLGLYHMEESLHTSPVGSLVTIFWLRISLNTYSKYDIIHIHYIFPNVIWQKVYKIFLKTKVVITLG